MVIRASGAILSVQGRSGGAGDSTPESGADHHNRVTTAKAMVARYQGVNGHCVLPSAQRARGTLVNLEASNARRIVLAATDLPDLLHLEYERKKRLTTELP